METVELQGVIRKDLSKSAKTKARAAGKVPGVFYMKGTDPISIEVAENAINPLVFTSEAHLINLKLDDQKEFECVLKDTQFDPVTDKVIHFDLFGIVRGQKLQIEIPVLLKGSPIGVREGGQLQSFAHKLTVECLPKDIPDHLEVDISGLKIGHSIHVSDLKYDNLVFLNPESTVIVSVTPPRGMKETDTLAAAEAPAEPEVISKGKAKETEE